MKTSQVLVIGVILTLIISVLALVKNENKEVIRSRNIKTGEIGTFDPDYEGWDLRRMSEESLEKRKGKQRTKILIIGEELWPYFLCLYLLLNQMRTNTIPLRFLQSLKTKILLLNPNTKRKYNIQMKLGKK